MVPFSFNEWLLSSFLNWWEAEIRHLSPEEWLLTIQIVNKIKADLDSDTLVLYLLPFLATSKEEVIKGKEWLRSFRNSIEKENKLHTSKARLENIPQVNEDGSAPSKQFSSPISNKNTENLNLDSDKIKDSVTNPISAKDKISASDEKISNSSSDEKLVIRQIPQSRTNRFGRFPIPKSSPVRFGRWLKELSNALHSPSTYTIGEIDIRNSVQKTIKNNGFFFPVFQETLSSTYYIFLIDSNGEESNHRANLFETFFQEIKKLKVEGERFFYSRSLEYCYNPKYKYIPISKISNFYPDSTLIVLGDGWNFLKQTTLEWKPFTSELDSWEKRILCTPIDKSKWTIRERILEEKFTLLNADSLGFKSIGGKIIQDGRKLSKQEKEKINQPRFSNFLESNVLDSFPEEFKSSNAIRSWIGALAFFPTLRWNLTLFLGLLVEEIFNEKILFYSNLQLLFRMPWFYGGQIPDETREILIGQLLDKRIKKEISQRIDNFLRKGSRIDIHMNPAELNNLDLFLTLNSNDPEYSNQLQKYELKRALKQNQFAVRKTKNPFEFEQILPPELEYLVFNKNEPQKDERNEYINSHEFDRKVENIATKRESYSRLFIFCIGGTGSRVMKSLLMLLAAGVKIQAKQIVPVFIDFDKTNGNLDETLQIINLYKQIQRNANTHLDRNNGFFKTEILLPDNMSSHHLSLRQVNDGIDSQHETLKDFIDYNSLGSDSTRRIVDLLFSKKNLEENLSIGFKGQPHIGPITFYNILNQEDFKSMCNMLRKEDRIFFISSVFGGTGASGFPSILNIFRDIDNVLPNKKIRATVKVGALVVLPYFKLEKKGLGVSIDSDSFMTRTKSVSKVLQ